MSHHPSGWAPKPPDKGVSFGILDSMRNQQALVDFLVQDGVLKTPAIIEAFRAIDRADFVPNHLRTEAYVNAPLPIGGGQTISQPWTVAFMLELLEPKRSQNILDVGSGSGWQTALLAQIVGGKGHVTALDVVPELCQKSMVSLDRYQFIQRGIVEVHCQDAHSGFAARAPYDRIIGAAMLEELPQAWVDQLQPNGLMVAPMSGSVWRWHKDIDGKLSAEEFPGFAFVPFVEK